MEKYLFPWKSSVMLRDPWIFPTFFIILSIILSLICWIKKRISN